MRHFFHPHPSNNHSYLQLPTVFSSYILNPIWSNVLVSGKFAPRKSCLFFYFCYFFYQLSVKFDVCLKIKEVNNVDANLTDGNMLTPT